MGKKTITVLTNEKKRIDIYMRENTNLTRSCIHRLIRYGKVLLNGKKIFVRHTKVKNGDIIEYFEEMQNGIEIKKTDIPLDIIYEDENILIINKQPGLVVHPAPSHLDDTLVNALIDKYIKRESFLDKGTRPGIIHRLDKDTSGVMIIAKNMQAREKFINIFKSKEITKIYRCIVHGEINEEGFINTNIGRDYKNRKKFTARVLGGKNAQTIYTPLEIFNRATLLNVRILTGRTHQIRVHMNFIGNEVVGDFVYGNKTKDLELAQSLGYTEKTYRELLPRQMLHAYAVEFIHPFKNKKMIFEADIPDDFNHLLSLLEKERKR